MSLTIAEIETKTRESKRLIDKARGTRRNELERLVGGLSSLECTSLVSWNVPMTLVQAFKI